MHSTWRTVEEWKAMNVPIATPSNEACKMYDAALTQYVTWKDQDSVGGIEGALEKMMVADPDFVMGQVIKNGLDLMGSGRSVKLDKEFQADIDNMVKLAESQSGVSASEKKHTKALKLFSEGFLSGKFRIILNYLEAIAVLNSCLVKVVLEQGRDKK